MDLRPIDIEWTCRRLPVAVAKAIQSRPGRCFLAGGFIRACIAGEEPKDIDLFVQDGSAALELAGELFGFGLASDPTGPPDCLHSDFAYTGTVDGRTVQVIHRWNFSTAADVLAHFDFTIARVVIWWREPAGDPEPIDMAFTSGESKWAGECDPNFYADLAARRLAYTNPEADAEPGGSILRAFKFAARGYRMPLDSLANLMAAVASQADPKVDRWKMAGEIRGRLREVDPSVDVEF